MKKEGDVQLSVSRLMVEDSLEVLDGNVWKGNASVDEVLCDELGEGLLVELGFQLLQHLGEFCGRNKG